MKPPKQVKVGPHVFDVQQDATAVAALRVNDLNGACLSDTLKLYLDVNLAPGIERSALLHEVMHAAWQQTTLPDKYDEKEEEAVIRALESYLFGVLRENPRLIAYLLETP